MFYPYIENDNCEQAVYFNHCPDCLAESESVNSIDEVSGPQCGDCGSENVTIEKEWV